MRLEGSRGRWVNEQLGSEYRWDQETGGIRSQAEPRDRWDQGTCGIKLQVGS
jgi:hypothetical protein